MVTKALRESAPPDIFSIISTEGRINTRSCARRNMQIPTVTLDVKKCAGL